MNNSGVLLKSNAFKNSVSKNSDLFFQAHAFEIRPGQKLLITGPSGSGKSTFLKFLMGLVFSDNSEIFFDDQKIINFLLFRKEIASYLSQSLNLVESFSLKENFKIENAANVSQINELFEKLNISKSINLNSMPYGLSPGEKQRISLIRQLLKPHKILLLDEPTSSLDTTNAEIVFKIIQSHPQACIVVSHDHRWSHYFDRVIAVEKIIQVGRLQI